MIGFVFVADRIAGRNVFHTADGDDLACARRVNIFAFVGVHQHQPTDALFIIL